MLDMNYLVGLVVTAQVKQATPFQSTGRMTGGQWFVKLHFDEFPTDLVLGHHALDLAWVQLGHPVYLTEDGKNWRPRPERPKITETRWLEGLWVDFRLEFKDFYTRWQGEKTYLAPRFLKLNTDRKS